MPSTSGVLTLCLDALDVLNSDQFPAERKADALRLLRARLPELGPKDTEQYYKVVQAMRDRDASRRALDTTGDDVRQRIDVEVSDAALPDPGLDWSF